MPEIVCLLVEAGLQSHLSLGIGKKVSTSQHERSDEKVLERAKAFHAKTQSRKGRKENKAVGLCESLRLGVFA
jgi:hypothetical protein